jgi:hypothetical protein
MLNGGQNGTFRHTEDWSRETRLRFRRKPSRRSRTYSRPEVPLATHAPIRGRAGVSCTGEAPPDNFAVS